MSNVQRHVIKRQIIELSVQGSAAYAFKVQDELSRIYRQRIIPMIDKRCSELSSSDRLHRIETLALDLGNLDMDRLEEDFSAKVDAALKRELAAEILNQEQAAESSSSTSRAQSQLELFVFFISTGSLPWWADISRDGLLKENLAILLKESQEALARELKKLLPSPGIRQRLIHQYNDDELAALCESLMPPYQTEFKLDASALVDELATYGEQSGKVRQSLWDSILMVAGADRHQHGNLDSFYQEVLKRFAANSGNARLLDDLHGAIQERRIKVSSKLAEMIAKAKRTESVPKESINQALAERLSHLQLQVGPGALSSALIKTNNLLPLFNEALKADLLTTLNNIPTETSAQNIALIFLRALETKTAEKHDFGTDFSELIKTFRNVAAGHDIFDQKNFMISGDTSVNLCFSQADEYPVTNAGLVILWPFLGHFFKHVGLLDEEHKFRDFAARNRAAWLLQVIATKEAHPPEYLLPLNKMLCGMDIETVFDFGPPLKDKEALECENLLNAVIAQAPILREMTPDGFRGSFLLRPGILGTRDGMGLLRVERQSYDIVLDRFPWSFEWVKQSWMEAPLRVEWE